MATFPKAPLRSRTVGFPESGSDPGSPPQAFPRGVWLKRWRAYTPDTAGLLVPYPRYGKSAFLGTVSEHRSPIGAAKYPEPLCPRQALPAAARCLASCRRAFPLRPRSYGLMRRTTALPPPPALASVGGSVQVVASPCWAMALPDVISVSPSLDAWAPIAAVRWVHLPVTSPTTSAFPPVREVGVPQVPAQRLQSGCRFRDCSHSLMFKPPSVHATQVAPTAAAVTTAGQPWRLRPSRTRVVTFACIGRACRPNEQLTAGDFHPISLTALSATPVPSDPCWFRSG